MNQERSVGLSKFTWKENMKFVLISWLGAWFIRVWLWTVRVEIIKPPEYHEYVSGHRGKKNAVFGFWHRHIFMMIHPFRKFKNVAVMISRSRDGEYVARAAERLGYLSVRGSSSRGGRSALRELIRFMTEGDPGKFCVTPMDGPRGPARKLKKGLLYVAKASGSVFVPISCSGTRVFTLKKTWDKTMLPLPFSKVVIEFHPPFTIPADLTDEGMAAAAREIEDALNALTDKLDEKCGYVPMEKEGDGAS
ncbi:MAG: lysophospholipid acyltransferase family protein [Desulfobacterales bacterium]|nr:lysophospholipid acyltransferase family protein [Desulfobacterales bacterium]